MTDSDGGYLRQHDDDGALPLSTGAQPLLERERKSEEYNGGGADSGEGSQVVVFDGETFQLPPPLSIWGPAPRGPWEMVARRAKMVAAAAASVALSPLLAFGVTAVLAINLTTTRLREHLLGLLVPPIMGVIDRLFAIPRAQLLKSLRGRVLDVGCASGHYLKYAKGKAIDEYVALEPNETMHGQLRATAEREGVAFKLTCLGGTIEDIGNEEDESFDAVILGNVLCEVDDQEETLRHVKRLLRSGGRVYFSEHVLDGHSPMRRSLQRCINPFWKLASGGCNCDRPTLHKLCEVFGYGHVVSWTFYVSMCAPHIARFELGIARKVADVDADTNAE